MKIKEFFPEIIVPEALEIGPKIKGACKKAYKKEVKIAFGTDAGVNPHITNAKEFGFMIEAIQSATITSVSVLRKKN